MPLISVRTFGPVELRVDGGEAPPGLRWRKHAALLIYLLLSPHRTRTRSHLLGLLWGEKSESAARHSLNEALRMLRKAAGEDRVRAEGESISLDDANVECDALAFDAAFAEARWKEAAHLLGGEFLEGFDLPDAPGFEDWVVAERERRRSRGTEALTAACAEALREGRASAALRLAERATAIDPLSERAACALMRARALAGDPGAALEAFARFERSLAAALGASPGPEAGALAARIQCEPMGPAAPFGVSDTRRTPLVGAGRELRALLEALERARDGQAPALFVVEGDVGTGKSRLAEEVLGRARLAGAVTSVVRAVESDLADDGGGLAALAAGGLLEARGLAAADPRSLATIAARVPAWGDRFPALRNAERHDSLVGAFADAVRAAAEEQAIVLAVDDAHWLDPTSLRALAATVREGAGAVAVLVTIDTNHARPEVDEPRARIGRELGGAAVRLHPLPVEALEDLVAWAFPEIEPEQRARLARRVHADSGGLPLLAVELLHALRLGLELPDAGPWPPPARTLDATRPGQLPDPVVAAIRIGFRRLGEDARAALCALAALEGRASRELIAAAAPLDPGQADRALDELEWSRWLVAEPRGYRFVAAVAREVVARDMLTAGQRQRILARAGRLTPA
jgi:DNA-binding SARP family transcriptional activator